MPYMKTADRDQMMLTSMDAQVDSESIARIIDAFVDSLDLQGMGFKKAESAAEGRPAYPPAALMKLYLYGYRKSIRSSRKLQEACKLNIEVRWLVSGLEPDFRTISDFRKDNRSCMKKVFTEFNKRLANVLYQGYFSVDGSKFAASNAKDRNFTSSKLDDRIEWLEKHTQEYLRELEHADEGAETDGRFTREELEEKLKEAEERLEKYKAYREYMEEHHLSQLSLTDADSKLMKSQNGFRVAYNVQTAVDSETHMIADFQVTNNPTDYGELGETLKDLKEKNFKDKIMETTADKGYQSGEDMAQCLANGIIPHVIPQDGQDVYELELPYEDHTAEADPSGTQAADIKNCLQSGMIPDCYKGVIEKIEVAEKAVPVEKPDHPTPKSPFQSEEEMKEKAAEGYFVRDPERNCVYCPGGKTLRQNQILKNGKIRYNNKTACKKCPHRDKCHSVKKGFKEVDFDKDTFVKGNGVWLKADGKKNVIHRRRMKRVKKKIVLITFRPDQRKMATRMCLSEHPFGTIKRAMHADYFLLRGFPKVEGEFALFALGYNLTRAVNLLGFGPLMELMTGLFSHFLRSLLFCMYTVCFSVPNRASCL